MVKFTWMFLTRSLNELYLSNSSLEIKKNNPSVIYKEYEWPQTKAAYENTYFIPDRKDPQVLYETGELLFYYASLLFVWLFISHSFCIYTQCMIDFMLP